MNAVVDGLAGVRKELASPTPLEWASFWLSVVNTLLVGSFAAIAAFLTYRFTRDRALTADRLVLRWDLRDWFQTLSRTAPPELQASRPALQARIEEEVSATGFDELATAMRWAEDMLETSYREHTNGTISEDEAHRLRIIVKRRFRQFVALWSHSRRQGKELIEGYTSKGWTALTRETGWQDSPSSADGGEAPSLAGAVKSIGALRPESEWRPLPRAWDI